MLRRDPNAPPNMLFIVSIPTSCCAAAFGPNVPATMYDWGESGLSIRYTAGLDGGCTDAICRAGALPPVHLPSSASNLGLISAMVVSPAIIKVALFGFSQVL